MLRIVGGTAQLVYLLCVVEDSSTGVLYLSAMAPANSSSSNTSRSSSPPADQQSLQPDKKRNVDTTSVSRLESQSTKDTKGPEGPTQHPSVFFPIFGWFGNGNRNRNHDTDPTTNDSSTKASDGRKNLEFRSNDRISKISQDIASHVDEILPKDPNELRETALFRNAYKLVANQRDQYLVGSEYAEWKRTKQDSRRLRRGFFDRRRQFRENELPMDPTALGHQQIADLAASFIPSQTMVNAALPLIEPLPGQVLFGPSKEALLGIIASQQTNLDTIMRGQIINVLTNPNIRTSIKKSTQGFLSGK